MPRPAYSGLLLLLLISQSVAATADEQTTKSQSADFFEANVRPLLVQHCIGCHGPDEQNAGLRLDSRKALLTGSESGPVIDAKRLANSRLLHAIKRSDDLAMPPSGPLSPVQVAALEKWILSGAEWPDSAGTLSIESQAERHWAFQPLAEVSLPDDYAGHPIDYFVDRRLQQEQLQAVPPADWATLIRRAAYSLTGLPPSKELLQAPADQDSAAAYQDAIRRLLDSPHYGEHWARHWLDVARYSDTKGYVYAREERFWIHAFHYRDWVISAFNNDLPYDRFLKLQIAADQIPDARPADLAAMGFLTLGRRFLGVERDIIDDRIDVVTRGTMALTASCARCHDHKYDPIPTADYYSLYGVFDSCVERQSRIDDQKVDDDFESELAKRQQTLEQKRQDYRQRSSDRARSRIRDYLFAQTELHRYPAKGFDQIFEESDLLPAFVRRWEAYLRAARRNDDPIFKLWHRFKDLAPEQFAAQARQLTAEAAQDQTINRYVREAFRTPPTTFQQVIDIYADVFTSVIDDQSNNKPQQENDPDLAALQDLLFGPNSPTVVPDEPIVQIESFFTSARCTELWKLQGEVDRWLLQNEQSPAFAVQLVDRTVATEPRIFLRGNPLTPGDSVPRRFLQVVSKSDRQPFSVGSGRLELARQIASDDNPLTARVIVNRVWAHHFGTGLVTTPSDFGLRSTPPSHPELLDWLTNWFIDGGWKIKRLHQLILTSSAYRRASRFESEATQYQRAMTVDPDNRLLWRFRASRLTFEQLRDSMLHASGQLDSSMFGKPQQLFDNPDNHRRTIYGLVDRQFLPTTLRVFDFANPDLHVPQRPETTIPQQALFLLNHPFVVQRAEAIAEQAAREASPRKQITASFEAVLNRSPTTSELEDAQRLLESQTPALPPAVTRANDWSYGYGKYDEARQQVTGFTPLPHFTGSAWQGGPKIPDQKLGWVQLTAVGGHPGNTREFACVRRWTAPADLTISIRSTLTNEPTQGDGIRGFIVLDGDRALAANKVHAGSVTLNVDDVAVSKGQHIDFVVDIDQVLNSDQFLWPITLQEQPAANATTQWNSEEDFSGDEAAEKLSPLAQLAQVLLLSNEFMFVD